MKELKEWEKLPDDHNFLSKVQQKIHEIDKSADIILYGSRTREETDQDSDWDFLVLVDGNVDQELTAKIRDSLYEIELQTDQIISCIVRSKKEWYSPRYSVIPFKRNVEKEGVLL